MPNSIFVFSPFLILLSYRRAILNSDTIYPNIHTYDVDLLENLKYSRTNYAAFQVAPPQHVLSVKEIRMDTKATVQALMDAVQKGDFEKAQSMFTSDFQFSGPVPEPISGPAWMGMSASLKNAFPDLNYQFKIVSVDGNMAHISAEICAMLPSTLTILN